MKRTRPSAEQIKHALAFQSLRLARVWRVEWLDRDETITRYAHPVSLAQVLSEHPAAAAAQPQE